MEARVSASATDAAPVDGVGAYPVTEEIIVARIERLPFSAWHLRTVALVGLASLFDAFDALTIAFVVPVLAGVWDISPGAIGLLISTGYVGQLIGAIALTALAERLGRLSALRLAVGILSALSIACAFASSYPILLALRFFQGIGLGGEVPIAATYINEACPARFRGRLVFLLELTFATGVMITSLMAMWLIPRFGWQSMFLVGGAPVLLAIWLGRIVPELRVGSRAMADCARPTKSCRGSSGQSQEKGDVHSRHCRPLLLSRILHPRLGEHCSHKAMLGARSRRGPLCSPRRLLAMA